MYIPKNQHDDPVFDSGGAFHERDMSTSVLSYEFYNGEWAFQSFKHGAATGNTPMVHLLRRTIFKYIMQRIKMDEFRTSQIYLQASSWQLAVLEHYCLANENGKVHPMSRATIPGRIWWAYLTMTAPMIFTVLFFPSWCPDTMPKKRIEMLKAQEDSKAIEAWLIERLGQRSLPAEKEHIMSKK